MNCHSIVFLLAIFLSYFDLYAENETITNNLDSLWTAATEHGKHGRFEESNTLYKAILKEPDLSGELEKAAWLSIANNANLSGDYKTYYDCLSRYYDEKDLSKSRHWLICPTTR